MESQNAGQSTPLNQCPPPPRQVLTESSPQQGVNESPLTSLTETIPPDPPPQSITLPTPQDQTAHVNSTYPPGYQPHNSVYPIYDDHRYHCCGVPRRRTTTKTKQRIIYTIIVLSILCIVVFCIVVCLIFWFAIYPSLG